MIDTLAAMTPALIVLFILGGGTLLLAYWLASAAEGRDEWVTGPCCPHPCHCEDTE